MTPGLTSVMMKASNCAITITANTMRTSQKLGRKNGSTVSIPL